MSVAVLLDGSAQAIAAAVTTGAVSAREIAQETLNRIEARNDALGAFTDVTAQRALAKADAIDTARARGENLGPLAGAPFAVKNLFDVAGLPTRAGSKINRDRPPAKADATVISRLEAAGGVLVGSLNMGEFAYDFTGENAHDGPSRNPHDLEHMTGGSSGGSGAAVAGGLVPISLGSDTNGSIRVPSSFCGLFGLKPTYGRLSRAGAFPFVASLDHVGPLARSVGDLALSYDTMLGRDDEGPGPSRHARTAGVANAQGRPRRTSHRKARRLFRALRRSERDLRRGYDRARPEGGPGRRTRRGRSSAFGRLSHHHGRRGGASSRAAGERARDFDPDVRDRLIAGAMLPGAWITQAQKFRRRFRADALALFRDVDILLAPATPCRAPRIGQKTFVLDGREMLVRPNIGLFTQPMSFIGLPVVAAPVWTDGEKLPIGVQIIAAPWREDLALRVAWALERDGVVRAPVATLS